MRHRLLIAAGIVAGWLCHHSAIGAEPVSDTLKPSALNTFTASFEKIDNRLFSYKLHSSSAPLIQVSTLLPQASYGSDSRLGTNTEPVGEPRKCLEFTPIWAYTRGERFEDDDTEQKVTIEDASSYGFRLAYGYQEYSHFEFFYSHQETELSDGVHYFPTKRAGLYVGARVLATFFNSEFELESTSESGTTVRFESDVVWQFQVFAGFTLVF